MDAIQNGTTSLRKANKHWNIPLTSLSNHLYGKTRFRKLEPINMLTIEEDQAMVAWVFSMQEVGLSISLQ